MDDKAKIVDKIRKLLALATSANEHEAASAAEKAQALLAEYNLSHSDIEQSVEEDEEDMVVDPSIRTDSEPWRRPIAGGVARMFFCGYVYAHEYEIRDTSKVGGYKRYDLHVFIGAEHNVEIAKIMFIYLYETVERLAREGSKKAISKSKYITSFRSAASVRLRRRIEDRIKAARAGEVKSATTGTNLPALASLYDLAQMKIDAVKDVLDSNRKAVRQQINISDAMGAADGEKAGNSIGLDQQIGGSNPKQGRIAAN